MIKKISASLLAAVTLIAIPLATRAAEIHIISNTNSRYKNGSYQLSDAMALVIHIADIILQVVGVLTFAMFIYGGFLFLISAGQAESIKKAKKIIVAAVIGLIIVFVSYLLVSFFIGTLTDKTPTSLPSSPSA